MKSPKKSCVVEINKTLFNSVNQSAQFKMKRGPATLCKASLGRVGFEHPPLKTSKMPISSSGGAKSDAQDAPKPIKDPELAKIIESWPKLPKPIKAAVKALIQTHNNTAKDTRINKK